MLSWIGISVQFGVLGSNEFSQRIHGRRWEVDLSHSNCVINTVGSEWNQPPNNDIVILVRCCEWKFEGARQILEYLSRRNRMQNHKWIVQRRFESYVYDIVIFTWNGSSHGIDSTWQARSLSRIARRLRDTVISGFGGCFCTGTFGDNGSWEPVVSGTWCRCWSLMGRRCFLKWNFSC